LGTIKVIRREPTMGKIDMTRKGIRRLIDEVGKLQTASSTALRLYKEKRGRLVAPLIELFGTDEHVRSASGDYQAILSHDMCDVVDVIKVIDKYNKGKISRGAIRTILCVKVGDARKLLTDELREELFVRRRNKEPTLHISRSEDNGQNDE
jgi:hypothetical protein